MSTSTKANGDPQQNDSGDGLIATKDALVNGDYFAHLFGAVALAGAGGIVFGAGVAVVAASLPRIESADMPSGVRRILFTAKSAVNGNATNLGWLAAINVGTEIDAKRYIDEYINSTGGKLMSYGGTVAPAGEFGNIVFVPANADRTSLSLSNDLEDLFVAPIDSATTKVGVAHLSINLGVPA